MIIIITIIIIIIITGWNQRGTRAGIYRQQQRFMRFLYQLSSAHYNWGRRHRHRYETDRSKDHDKK